ncbi:unnamed protein product [Gongylonema pulchrum]|uniref:Uncharacterized protein n=1 Tax=Gongylonema pulchrum TaxID=637853 RepID=A0A183DAZ5_9BILA|nr:unnamed protein product [Gongylonema pulchrum]
MSSFSKQQKAVSNEANFAFPAPNFFLAQSKGRKEKMKRVDGQFDAPSIANITLLFLEDNWHRMCCEEICSLWQYNSRLNNVNNVGL